MAVQESENVNNERDSLLSNEDSIESKSEENVKMDDAVNEDILAVAKELSEDLSTMANASVKEEVVAEEVKQDEQSEPAKAEEAPAETAPEVATEETADSEIVAKNPELVSTLKQALDLANQIKDQELVDVLTAKLAAVEACEEINGSTEVTETAEEQGKEIVVDSVNAETSEENKEAEEAKTELTGEQAAPEQDVDDSNKKIQALEEENNKLRSALHRTLVERVVDAKIAIGIENYDAREALVADHIKRTASSLADSLRDLAGMPAASKAKGTLPEINSEIEAAKGETGVITLDGVDEEEEVEESTPFEDIFVDALMGRRKL